MNGDERRQAGGTVGEGDGQFCRRSPAATGGRRALRRIDVIRGALGVLVLGAVAGCGSPPRLAPESPYTEKVRGDFGVACRRQDINTEKCNCIFDYYKEAIDFETFQQIMEAGATPHEIGDTIAERCGVQVRRI
jgi:hypothetical protein